MRSSDFTKCLYYCDYKISFSFFDYVLFKYFIKNYEKGKIKNDFMKNFEKDIDKL